MVNRNDECVLTIERVDQEARGVARVDGYVWLVPGSLPGERVRARVIKPGAHFAVARLMEVLEPSPERTDPKCPIYTRCGGCVWQHAKYESTLAYKENYVRDCLSRIGAISNPAVLPILGMKNPWRYRNKGSFPVSGSSGKPLVGCYAARSHDVIDAPQGCLLQTKVSDRLVSTMRGWMSRYHVEPFDETTRRGLIRYIATRVNERGESMLTIVSNSRSSALPHARGLICMLRDAEPRLSGISVSPNDAPGNAVFGEACKTIWGKRTLTETLDLPLGPLSFEISPHAFFQVNTAQAVRLASVVSEFARVSPGCRVADVYSGAGALTLALAQSGADAVGIEINSDAVEDARNNAVMNGMPHVRFIRGDAADALPKLVLSEGRFDRIALDPPRKGCDSVVLEAAAHAKPDLIIYVSCDPATLARDVSKLRGHGYAFVKAQPIDMFCWTSSVETVALFSRV